MNDLVLSWKLVSWSTIHEMFAQLCVEHPFFHLALARGGTCVLNWYASSIEL